MRLLLAALMLASLGACNEAPSPDQDAKTTAKVPPQNAAQKAYANANEQMHKGMAAIDADADVAFMQGMIAHHKGAIEMSRVLLEHGKDAKTREMAEKIIAAQQSEIAEMEAWLKARNVAPAATVDHAAMGH